MKQRPSKAILKPSLQENLISKREQQTINRVRKPHKFIKQIVIDNQKQLDKINAEFDKYIFKVFDRDTLQECSKRGGYFDNKIISFEKPFGQQEKKQCIIISKYIHSKCLNVKSLSILLPELDTHINQSIDVDDETVQKLFTSIAEVAESGRLEHLEIDLKSWKRCTDFSIKSIADCFQELFTKGKNLTHFIINLNNWKEVTETGAILLANSLSSMKDANSNLIHLNLSFEGWNLCTQQASEEIIIGITEAIQKASQIEEFKFSLWNWGKCNDRSCELISQLMQDLSDQCQRLHHINFNLFGWTKCTDYGLEEICTGVTSLFEKLNGLLNFNLNISGWRGITQNGINLISKTFRDCIFNLQPYLVDATIIFSKSDRILTTCSKFLRARFMARMQFMAFYKYLEWHVNSPVKVSQDLYIDTLNKDPEPQQQEIQEEISVIQLKTSVKMPAYQKNQSLKNSQKQTVNKMKF